MTALKRRTPCEKCPFKRTSEAGWLGRATPDNFVRTTVSGIPMPCHPSIDYSDPDWLKNQMPFAAHCAGSLIFLKNKGFITMDPVLTEMISKVKVDTENVFATSAEFMAHHGAKNA